MKIMHGLFYRAFAKRSLTLLAPTPTYISTNSEAVAYKKELLDSPEVAFASIVFPVPGGPYIKMPFLRRAPTFKYFVGSRK